MRNCLSAGALAVLALAFGLSAHAQQPVLQRGYDANVDGANLTEGTLNTSNVAVSTFGVVFKLPVDDNVYAQPLYVPNVAISGQGTHNVVYVATMSDSLYAFDADTGVQLWKVNFASSVGATPVPYAKFAFAGNMNVVGNLGILSTPVIDSSTHILYLAACTLENNTMVYRLHAVNITSGTEPYTNVVITGSYGGSTFLSTGVTQRLSLVLSGNQVVFGFGALEAEASDVGGYVGWVMAYNKTTLAQSGAFATVTTGTRGGGVWQSGRPPVVDSSGYVYVFVGNGYTAGYDGVNNFNESVLKLNPATGLSLVDWFTPDNWSTMDGEDLDLTSSGPMLIPGTSLIAGGGKTGILYVLNTANLGKESAGDSGAVQELTIAADQLHGGPVYWQRSSANGGPLFYDWGDSDLLKAYAFDGSTFATSPSAEGGSSSVWPGGILALSANGDTPGSGVLWAAVATSGDVEGYPPVPGALYAFDANNVATELWDSTMNSARDNLGNFAKFVPPVVVNGKVYVATQSNQVVVYGLLPAYTASPTSLSFGNEPTNVASAPKSVQVTNTGAVALPITSITLSSSGSQPFSQSNNCGSSVAVGANCTINVVFDPASAGAATATLSIKAGNGAGTQTVGLSGTGVVPTYTASPTSLSFGNELTNVASAPKAVTVTNTGVGALPITSITLSSSGSQPFSQTNTCGSSVAVGANCTINVVFDPASAGAATATLSINAGNGAGTQTVALSGTGIVLAVTLSAAPTSVTLGNSVTLTWTSSNAATCVASGGQSGDGWAGAKPVDGTAKVTPSAAGTIVYTMTCSSGSQNAQAAAQVIATSPSSGSSGGGALDAISILSLLTLIGLRERRIVNARTRKRHRRVGGLLRWPSR